LWAESLKQRDPSAPTRLTPRGSVGLNASSAEHKVRNSAPTTGDNLAEACHVSCHLAVINSQMSCRLNCIREHGPSRVPVLRRPDLAPARSGSWLGPFLVGSSAAGLGSPRFQKLFALDCLFNRLTVGARRMPKIEPYLPRVHRRALADAQHAVSLETGDRLFSVILGTLFVATSVFTIGSSTGFVDTTALKIVLVLLAILVAPMALFVALYIWNLFRVLVRIALIIKRGPWRTRRE
jgi:hypothetical protein